MSIAWCDGRVGIVGMWVSLGCGLRAENRAQEQKIETYKPATPQDKPC
jgi:hypothetical protein